MDKSKVLVVSLKDLANVYRHNISSENLIVVHQKIKACDKN